MKVKILPYQPHCFAFGGFEIQMLSAFKSIRDTGGSFVDKMDVWSTESDFDILHCWGFGLANYENILWAKRANKKVVVTALIPYFESAREKLRFFISSKVYKSRLHLEMAALIDHVVVVNELQADVFSSLFKVPKTRISIIPNIIENIYYNGVDHSTNHPFDNESYVLTTGNICERKNQLQLAKGCIDSNINLLIVGKVLHGEEEYANKLLKVVNGSPNIKWIPGLAPHSTELYSVYKECSAFALPSYVEQQPISLLEAAALRKPLLIADKAYAKQKYYRNAMLVKPSSTESIAKGLTSVLSTPDKYCVPSTILEECKAENVGSAYLNVYNQLL